MTKINISKDKLKFINLHKSFFSDLKNTECEISETQVHIFESSGKNPDPASIELVFKDNHYILYYWDGYSLAEKDKTTSYKDALSQFKKYAKKLAKNLRKF